jgi:ankyrin repeat protein
MSVYIEEIFHAVRHGMTEQVKDLVALTGNPNLQDNDGWTLLMAVVESPNTNLMKFPLEWPELDVNAKVEDPRDRLEFTALNIAMEKGNEDMVQMLRERGAKRILVGSCVATVLDVV